METRDYSEGEKFHFYGLLTIVILATVQFLVSTNLEVPDHPIGKIQFSCTYGGCYSDYPDVVDNIGLAIVFFLFSLCFVRLKEHYFKAMSISLGAIGGFYVWHALWHKVEMITAQYFIAPFSLILIDVIIFFILSFGSIKLILSQFFEDEDDETLSLKIG